MEKCKSYNPIEATIFTLKEICDYIEANVELNNGSLRVLSKDLLESPITALTELSLITNSGPQSYLSGIYLGEFENDNNITFVVNNNIPKDIQESTIERVNSLREIIHNLKSTQSKLLKSFYDIGDNFHLEEDQLEDNLYFIQKITEKIKDFLPAFKDYCEGNEPEYYSALLIIEGIIKKLVTTLRLYTQLTNNTADTQANKIDKLCCEDILCDLVKIERIANGCKLTLESRNHLHLSKDLL